MRVLLLTGLLTLAELTAAWGMPTLRDLIDVPIDRIVANLEARLAKEPRNARVHHALARAHAIAYAQGKTSITLSRPAFGPSKPPPDETQLANDPLPPQVLEGRRADPAVARRHLEKAVTHYREATRLDPGNLPAAIGYGWTLDLSGEKVAARGQYRAALGQAVQRRWLYEAREVGSYLLRLLDPQADQRELAQLKATLANVEKLIKENEAAPRPVTPIVVPLVAGASFDELVAREAAVPFDLDGSGLPRRWQWITPRAGWLVYEGTGERDVDSGIRLIGSRTFWIFWSDGYAAMAALDDDGDGQLAGGELRGLAIWQDTNSNGVTERGEVRRLREWGIVALSCAHRAHPEGFLYSPQGAVFADGSVRPTYDWVASSVPASQGQATAVVPAAARRAR